MRIIDCKYIVIVGPGSNGFHERPVAPPQGTVKGVPWFYRVPQTSSSTATGDCQERPGSTGFHELLLYKLKVYLSIYLIHLPIYLSLQLSRAQYHYRSYLSFFFDCLQTSNKV